jgi:hypothetical protein
MPPKPPESPEITAALLWDTLALRRIASPGADAFVDAFGPGPLQPPTMEDAAEDDVLLLAAGGVIAERNGHPQHALEFFDRIRGDFWEELLRLCLRAWSAATGTEDLPAAAGLATELPTPSEVRSHLFAKLMTLAYDKFAGDLVRDYLNEALKAAADTPRVRMHLAFESSALLGEFVPLPEGRIADLPEDRHSDRPSIDSWALLGAKDYLVQLVEERARGPWSHTIRMGRGPIDEAYAADLQATWAGAIGQRRTHRRLFGAELLLAEPAGSAQAVFAAWTWFEGGGGQHRDVCNLVEPRLDTEGADSLLQALSNRIGPRDSVDYTLARVANALWDSCSEEMVLSLFERLIPHAGEHPALDDIRQLWAALALRAPAVFGEHLRDLDGQAKRDLAPYLSSEAVQALDEDAVGQLSDALEGENEGPELFRVTALLNARSGSPQAPTIDVAEASPADVIDTETAVSGMVPREAIARALRTLLESLDEERRAAREGKFAFGGYSVPQAVARAILLLGDREPATTQLVSFVADGALQGQSRIEGLHALAMLARDGLLSAEHLQRVREMTGESAAIGFSPLSPELFAAAQLLVLAAEPGEIERGRLLALSRSRDERVRQLAVNAVAVALSSHADETLRTILIGALFDVSEAVIRQAINGITPLVLRELSARTVILDRFGELLMTRRRGVRAAVASSVRQAAEDLELREEFAINHLLERASEDSSWQVRRAAGASAAEAGR